MDIETDFSTLWLSFFMSLVFRSPMFFTIIHIKALQPVKKKKKRTILPEAIYLVNKFKLKPLPSNWQHVVS